MNNALRVQIGTALVLLLLALLIGLLAALSYSFPALGALVSFKHLRPAHVSAALFWIITGATVGVVHYRGEVWRSSTPSPYHKAFVLLWIVAVVAILFAYAGGRFGGREYWEFPPVIGLLILAAWVLLLVDHLRAWVRRTPEPPLYVWMWTTGVFFFLLTFIEQNLWQIDWFRQTYVREITVQWRSNGAMVGAWNQMIYGTALYLMTRISGDDALARGPKVFLFWFLGLANLMFNWGHHIYNVPTAAWIRHVAYGISMLEWIFFINIIRGFKAKLGEYGRHKKGITYRFLVSAELWVFLNLFLALLMSIPAVNRYTHGTHITVAHAMGTTIGINTMILLGSFTYMLGMDREERGKRWLGVGLRIALFGLGAFWLALLIAGAIKGWRTTALGITDHQRVMRPVNAVLEYFVASGAALALGLGIVAVVLLNRLLGSWRRHQACLHQEDQANWK